MPTEETVKQLLASLNIDVPEERLAQLAAMYRQALAQSASIRETPTPTPAPSSFDPAWDAK